MRSCRTDCISLTDNLDLAGLFHTALWLCRVACALRGRRSVPAYHPPERSICRAGNRHGLWVLRHDALEAMVAYVIRRAGRQCIVVSRGAGNWFGAAAIGASGRVRKADLVLPGHLGMGRHLFLDTAIVDPTSGSALGHGRLMRLALG